MIIDVVMDTGCFAYLLRECRDDNQEKNDKQRGKDKQERGNNMSVYGFRSLRASNPYRITSFSTSMFMSLSVLNLMQ